MNLEIGYEFEYNGSKYCLLDILTLDSKRYAMFSVEKGQEKLNFQFFEIDEDATDFNFTKVVDDNINNLLLQELERRNNGGQ